MAIRTEFRTIKGTYFDVSQSNRCREGLSALSCRGRKIKYDKLEQRDDEAYAQDVPTSESKSEGNHVVVLAEQYPTTVWACIPRASGPACPCALTRTGTMTCG
jgi:hypothetical protein